VEQPRIEQTTCRSTRLPVPPQVRGRERVAPLRGRGCAPGAFKRVPRPRGAVARVIRLVPVKPPKGEKDLVIRASPLPEWAVVGAPLGS
jgi:hypothetical protein